MAVAETSSQDIRLSPRTRAGSGFSQRAVGPPVPFPVDCARRETRVWWSNSRRLCGGECPWRLWRRKRISLAFAVDNSVITLGCHDNGVMECLSYLSLTQDKVHPLSEWTESHGEETNFAIVGQSWHGRPWKKDNVSGLRSGHYVNR